MANIANAYGFIPVTPNARQNAYTILSTYGTAINIGDPVLLTGTGLGALPEVNVATAGTTAVGVFAGCDYTDSNGQPQWGKAWPASTTATNIIAHVYDDPTTEFRIEYTGTFAVTDYGAIADWVAGTASNPGISGYTVAATGADGLQIRRLYDAPGNSVGVNAQIIVAFREHTYNYPYTAV